jgi:hypothetical protein
MTQLEFFMVTHPTPAESTSWQAGGGEMGVRIRAFDWSSTPLGPIEIVVAGPADDDPLPFGKPLPAALVVGTAVCVDLR